jgi:acetyl esterase/lipase
MAGALAHAAALAPACGEERALRAAGASPPAELRELVTVERDVPYAATDNPRQRLDLYLPKSRQGEALPVIVFLHGGGWLEGDKSSEVHRLVPWLRTGRYAGVSAGYRLSGEASWPAQIHDCKAAIRWVRANAGKYGLAADRIGVWGTSAGGHLAVMLGVSGDVPALEGELGPHRGVSSRVAGVVNFFGPTELLAMIGQPSDIDRARADAPEARLVGGGLRENAEKAKAASPVAYASPDDAPVLTVHGTLDRTVPYDQGVRLDAALREAGVASYLVTIQGGGHGDFGTAANDRVDAFFARYLLGENVEVKAAAIEHRRR